MATCLKTSPHRVFAVHQAFQCSVRSSRHLHSSAGSAVVSVGDVPYEQSDTLERKSTRSTPCLAQLPTANIVRNLVLGAVFSSSIIVTPGMAALKVIAEAKSPLLNPDKNPLLRALIKPILYRHFCAGENKAEVQGTVRGMKELGFAGVILANGREIFFNAKPSSEKSVDLESDVKASMHEHTAAWLNDNLQTIDMICEGDILALKLTGAGPEVANLLATGAPIPDCIRDAFKQLCSRARAKGLRIWIDAEQRKIQPTIDEWAVELMRQHNKHGDALILNTVQSYLKNSRDVLGGHLRLAQKEGWTLGVKLVRGAYIASEERSIIHDTKAETDACYNGIARDLMTKSWPGFLKSEFPNVKLFLAGHNQESVRLASSLARQLAINGEQANIIGFGQLQGMADEVSCDLLAEGKQVEEECSNGMCEAEAQSRRAAAPKAYKCTTWGSVQESMQYLVRRATENRGAADRIKEGLPLFRKELWRRMTTRSA